MGEAVNRRLQRRESKRFLCELSEFKNPLNDSSKLESPFEKPSVNVEVPVINEQLGNQDASSLVNGNCMSLNINIELHLPATQDGEVYDKLFSALKRHLL